jgi:hypothetical protein
MPWQLQQQNQYNLGAHLVGGSKPAGLAGKQHVQQRCSSICACSCSNQQLRLGPGCACVCHILSEPAAAKAASQQYWLASSGV